jgi:hypothetical protein
MAGMAGSKNIVAINKDADSNMVKVSKFAIIDDYKKVVPALIEEIKKLGRRHWPPEQKSVPPAAVVARPGTARVQFANQTRRARSHPCSRPGQLQRVDRNLQARSSPLRQQLLAR